MPRSAKAALDPTTMTSSRRVFLTGASAGIGLVAARTLCALDCEVWGTSRDVARLPQDLPKFHPLALSLNDPRSIETAWTEAKSASGGIDVLINNAGAGWFGALGEMPEAKVREQFETLVFGPLQLIRLALPELRDRKGLLINVTSLAARLPIPFMAPYSAAKAALAALTAALRLELSDSGVRIVDLQPGDIRTDFNDAMQPPTDEQARVAWDAMAASMAGAPGPEIVAAEICRLVQSNDSPPTRILGDFLQARLAPLAARLLPTRWMERILLDHYR
jgi:NAD(P)-dependent dehydrogenase (short-subunit alcohol dehydrogenase family)